MADRSKFEINGIVNTSNNVLSNIELLASSAGSFITWDSQLGQWAVIVNETGTSVKSFDDSNILGAINVSGTGVSELYNSVQIAYPHKDLRDATDYVTVSISTADRFPQEIDNQLQITLDTINNPIQAQILASQELKQNRVDKIVQFRSDYTANGLKAGDLIDITNTVYGYTNKVFRIIQIEEEDTDEGAIIYSITGLEYDSNVYTTTNLEYDFRTTVNSIPSKITNEVLEAEDDIDAGASIGRLLAANAAAGLFNSLLQSLFGDRNAGGNLTDAEATAAEEASALLSGAKKPPLTHSASTNALCEGGSVTITLTDDCETCYFTVPDFEYEYEITGIDEGDISIPLTGTVQITNGTGSISFDVTEDADLDYETMTFTCGENSTDVVLQSPRSYSYESISATSTSITEGDSVDITITSANIPDGETRDYTITGTAVDNGSVSTATTGTVTFNSDEATITIATANDGVYTGGESYTFTVDPTFTNPCAVNDEREITISVADDETAPPFVAPDDECETVTVPIVYCGNYDPNNGYLKSLTVAKSMTFSKPSTGGTTVPLTVSVSNPGTSSASISIDSTTTIDTSAGQAGISVDIITSFDAPTAHPNTTITGTTTSAKGY
jgi:hypothetical protein